MDKFIFEETTYINKYAYNIKKIEYIVNNNNCFLCVSHILDKDGYAKIKRNNKYYRITRYIYEIIHNVSLSPEQYVMHICDTPQCINPDHLKLGTNQENIQDRNNKNRQASRTKNGEAKLTEQDIINIRNDNRSCRKIAKDYPVHFSQMPRIKSNNAWKN